MCYLFLLFVFFFFFKQKTAYEMRISDWSSDVCSSDLKLVVPLILPRCGELIVSSNLSSTKLITGLLGIPDSGCERDHGRIFNANRVKFSGNVEHVVRSLAVSPNGCHRHCSQFVESFSSDDVSSHVDG